MPFDLGDDAARLCPASRLIAEIRVEEPHFVWRSPNRARKQMADPFLQDAVRRQPDRVFDPFGFKELQISTNTGLLPAGHRMIYKISFGIFARRFPKCFV